MASCDEEFSLIGDDNATTSQPSTNPNPNLIHHRQPFGHRNISAVNNEDDDVVSADADGYSDDAFGSSQPNNPTLNNPNNISQQTYRIVSYESDPNPFEHDQNPNKARGNRPNEKRSDREEVSDSGTPYLYKRSRVCSSATGQGGGGGVEYRKDREEWSDPAIAYLLDAYTEKFIILNRGNLRGRDWEDVAAIVTERCGKQSKSVEQCKNKVDNLKKRYKLERHRLNNGGVSASHWPWFKQMELIVGNSSSSGKGAADDEKSAGGSANSSKQSKRYATTTAVSPGGVISNVKSKPTTNTRWRRVVFKVSGATLSGAAPHNVDPKVALLVAREVSIACRSGVEVAIVVGARNFFCGHTLVATSDLDRYSAYQMGMMATVMNALLLQSAFQQLGMQTRVLSAHSMPNVSEAYCRLKAIRHLEKGRVLLFAGIGGGAGNQLFSTDFAAALRASESMIKMLS
ncbi:OLC1v1034363C2 [Oldenlandia corymbosa var. corymbosa]|uniref:UMP kinase n=1 Tax=Oldenlandia corymbosa var. corymbosa TaxID=529605 RepID=A0AAV1CR82_OLDCO|nr:OLC1v1034363C2 [Oldenlandia corymbosa var. corymbosa]